MLCHFDERPYNIVNIDGNDNIKKIMLTSFIWTEIEWWPFSRELYGSLNQHNALKWILRCGKFPEYGFYDTSYSITHNNSIQTLFEREREFFLWNGSYNRLFIRQMVLTETMKIICAMKTFELRLWCVFVQRSQCSRWGNTETTWKFDAKRNVL